MSDHARTESSDVQPLHPDCIRELVEGMLHPMAKLARQPPVSSDCLVFNPNIFIFRYIDLPGMP